MKKTYLLSTLLSLTLLTVPHSSWAQSDSDQPSPEATAVVTAAPTPTLEKRLRQIEGMEEVKVLEQSGVVTLRGSIQDSSTRKLAEDVAKKTDGVIAVRNELLISSSVAQRLGYLSQEFEEKVGAAILFLPLLVLAILLIWLSNFLGRKVSTSQWLQKRSKDPFLLELLRRSIHGGFVFAGLLTALSLLGATALVGAVAGSAGVLGLALGFAFKDIAENYVAGLLLSLRRPFSYDDFVRIDEFEGKVAALTPRETILVMLDGRDLRIPNAMVFKSVLINYTRNALRRFEFEVVLDRSVSITTAQKTALALIAEAPGVIPLPAPSSSVLEYGSDGSKMVFYAWVNQRESDLFRVRSNCIRAVKGAFKELGFDIYTHEILVRHPSTEARPATAAAAPVAAAASTSATALVHDVDHAHADVSVNRDIDQAVRDTRQEVQQDTLVR